jgi:hypothetical protein
MASARSSSKDLLNRISPGSPQDLLLRTGTGSCKDLLERNLAGSLQEPAYERTYNENAPGQELENRAAVQTLREPAQSETHMDISQEPVYAKIYNENAADQELENPAAQTLCKPAQSK